MNERPHTHEGPRTGQTSDDTLIHSCEQCGVSFVEGLEDLDRASVKEMMDLLYGDSKEDVNRG